MKVVYTRFSNGFHTHFVIGSTRTEGPNDISVWLVPGTYDESDNHSIFARSGT